MTLRLWTDEQDEIFNFIKTSEDSLVVRALAGTGKTTTLEECVRREPHAKKLVLAFNKPIQEELAERLKDDWNTDVLTCNAYGNMIVRDALPDKKFNQDYVFQTVKRMQPYWKYEVRKAVVDLVSAAKHTLAVEEDLDWTLDRFGIRVPLGAVSRAEVVSAARRMLQASIEGPFFDYNDQVWLPHVLKLERPTYDVIFGDEVQDWSPANLELALSAGGRLVCFGDENQSIYQFRGADKLAMNNIVQRTNARVLPLTTTFRCPKAVVELAQQLVPELQARPSARLGRVNSVSAKYLITGAASGDFVISRTNAALVKACLKMWAADKPAFIVGRDICAGLQKLVKSFRAESIPVLLDCLNRWESHEVKRLKAKERPTIDVEDKAECLRTLVKRAPSLDALDSRLELLFKSQEHAVQLMTTHKAKGLENDVVWVLRDTYRPEEGGEEANLLYVAVTRSKDVLYMVQEEEEDE